MGVSIRQKGGTDEDFGRETKPLDPSVTTLDPKQKTINRTLCELRI